MNTRFLRVTILFAVATYFSDTGLAQGDTGFLRGKGRFDVAPSYSVDSYDKFWVGSDRVEMDGVGKVTRTAYNLYAAYGLRDDMDLMAAASWVVASSDGVGMFPRESDPQDLAIGLKWRLAQVDGFSLLVAPAIKLPMSDYEDGQNRVATAIGDGQTDYRGRVIGHYQTGRFFASLETGYDRRSGRPDDEIPIHVTLGYTVAERLTVSPFYSRVDSLEGPDLSEGTPFPSVEEDYERAGIKLYYQVSDQFGLSALAYTTLDGRNTADSDTLGVGVVFRF